MPRPLSPATSLDVLKKDARRWLTALRAGDAAARQRLFRAHANAPEAPTLRDVQHALAAEYGFVSWVALTRRVADLRAGRGESPRERAIRSLLVAADKGDAAGVAAVLDDHPDIIDQRGALEGHTGLRTALHVGIAHEAIVRLLLQRGADPNVRDQGDNAFPLHFAAERGDVTTIRLLVEHGALTTAGDVDDHQLDIIGWATCFENSPRDPAIVRYLLEHGARHTILSATATGDTAALREIVGQSPRAVDRVMDRTNHRRRPLHLAVVKKQHAALATLLALGADPDATDASGLTALDHAALDGELVIAQALIDHGASIQLPAAVCLQRTGDIERLLRGDRDALRPSGRWGTLIVRAAGFARGEIIDTLVAHGASVDVADALDSAVDGTANYTPLHAAAWKDNVDAARALLRHGASPRIRDGRYRSTPAGWAEHARQPACRDSILASPDIDVFDAISLNRADRIDAILERDPAALTRPFRAYADAGTEPGQWWPAPDMTPLDWATAAGRTTAARVLTRHGAELSTGGHHAATPAARAAAFLRTACLDWAVGGPDRERHTHAAARLLTRHPEIAHASLCTAVVCGEIAEVTRLLLENASVAGEPGGPRRWPPLLYLCAARLPDEGSWSRNAVAMATLLLDRGADPNASYEGGNADIHYTALACLVGRGEEQAAQHPHARELAALLLERGAEPYDTQLLYNAFGWHAGHRMLRDEGLLWLLDLVHRHSVRSGREADWRDPEWAMLSMGGYGCGAWYLLYSALTGNDLALTEWVLSHGASADPPRASDSRMPPGTLYDQAVRNGQHEFAALLARHGAATSSTGAVSGREQFMAACFRVDRRQAAEALVREHPEYLTDPAPLLKAAERDRADVAALLVDLGMSPDVDDPQNRTRALHLAAYHGSEAVIRVLIDRGAEIDPRDGAHDNTPIGWAHVGRRARAVDLLTPHTRDVWVLTNAGKVDRLAEVLVGAARPPRTEDDLLLFSLPDDDEAAVEVVRLLLAKGEDPSIRRPDGTTAAQVARARGLDAAAAMLAEPAT